MASLLVVLMAVVLVFTASCASGEGEAKVIKMGLLGPLTGPAASYWLPAVRAAEMTAEEVNAAGGIVVGGERYTVEIVSVDDMVSAERSVDGAHKLIFDDKVRYIRGPIGVTCSGAVQPIAEENKVVLMSGTIAEEGFPIGTEYPYSFAALWLTDPVAMVGYRWLAENHPEVKRVALIARVGPTGDVSERRVSERTQEHGMELVIVERYEAGTMDFSPHITRILAKDPDLIDTDACPSGESSLIVKQAREMGYEGLFYSSIAPSALVLSMVAGEYAEGFIVSTSRPDFATGTPEQQAFYQKFVARYGEEAWSAIAHAGVDMVYSLKQAFEAVDSFDPEVVMPYIEETPYEGLAGKSSYVEAGWGVKRQNYSEAVYLKIFRNEKYETIETFNVPYEEVAEKMGY